MKRAIIIGFLLVISAAANAQVFFGIGLSKYRSFYRSEEYVVDIGHSHDFYYGHDEYYVSFEHYIINDRPVKSGSFSSVFGYQYKRFTYGFAFDYNQLQWRNGSHNLKESTISICPLFRYDLIQKDKIDFFLEASCCFANSIIKQDNLTSAREGGVCFGVQPGIRYHFNSHWSMVAYWGMIAYSGNGNVYNFDGWNFTFDTKSVSFDVYFNF